MKLLQKNIWLAFYIIFSLGVLLLGVILYSVYKNTYNDIQIEQENIVKVSTNSVNNLLHQYEVVLDILGNELLQNENYKDVQKSSKLIDNLLGVDLAASAYAVTKPNGEVFILESKNMPRVSYYPNILEKEETKESFLKTLKSDTLVVGRTYYLNEAKKLVIPMRKAIKDEEGKVLFVTSVALLMDKNNSFLIYGEKTSNYNIFIYRGEDRYFQIAPKEKINDPEIYKYQFLEEDVNKQIQSSEKKYNMSFDEIKNKEIITNNENKEITPHALLTSLYLKKYDLWIVAKTELSKIMASFYKIAFFIVVIFIVVNILIFWLFRKIYISEKKKKETLEFQATHDYLTNLHNRLYLDKNLNSLEKENPFYLFFIDLDNFKTINDSYGHEYGDKVLIEISRRLSLLKKEKDILVRYSGDEFLLFVYDLDSKEVEKEAKTILKELSKLYIIFNTNFHLTTSIGVSSFPNDGKTLDEIKRYADLALYESKKKKNTFTIFNENIKEKYLKYINLESKMKKGFENNEFYMVYQPQVCNSGNLCGLEALVRWENDEIGFIGPDVFISVAESSEQMVKLGKYILTSSLKEIKNLESELNTNATLSINISIKQFMEEGFVEFLSKTLDEIAFDKKKLQLEITESIFIEDIEYIIDILNKLRKENIRISLDDFGTGYSSLSLLNKLPIDELKIDKSFVDNIIDKETSKTMVESIMAIAKKMNMKVVAEGIEEIEQKEILEKMGCDLYQGYHFSKPLRIDDLKKFVKSK